MDIIKELENLKSRIAGKASTSIELTSYPPQHPFAAGVSVESVISDIDNIILKFTSTPEGNGNTSAAARRLRYIVDQGDFSSDQVQLLLEIANMIDHELKDVKNYNHSNASFVYPEINSNNLTLKSLFAFIKGYVDSEGPCTVSFIQQLYNIITELDQTTVKANKTIDLLEKEANSLYTKIDNLYKIGSNIRKKIQNHS